MVTAIEVLSLTNKTMREQGRKLYLRQRGAGRGSPDPAPQTTDRSHKSGRPAVGGFGEVGRPAPSTSTSQIHLVEIDLLRGGQHTTAVPLPRVRAKAGPFDYHVFIHRFDNLEDYFVYPIRLQDRLPEIAIPLLPGDGDVTIDLQEIFQRSYDAGPYRRRIRYRQTEPVPPLAAEAQQWAAQLLS